MKRIAAGFLAATLLSPLAAVHAADLASGFVNPPDSARPGVYWYFMDGNQDRAAMTADLEAMHKAGLRKALFLEVNIGVPRGPVDFMSEQWQENFAHAVRTADRLGMEIILGTGPGWCGAGGPWIDPARSMQHLQASSVEIAGPGPFAGKLPIPPPRKPPQKGSRSAGKAKRRNRNPRRSRRVALPLGFHGIPIECPVAENPPRNGREVRGLMPAPLRWRLRDQPRNDLAPHRHGNLFSVRDPCHDAGEVLPDVSHAGGFHCVTAMFHECAGVSGMLPWPACAADSKSNFAIDRSRGNGLTSIHISLRSGTWPKGPKSYSPARQGWVNNNKIQRAEPKRSGDRLPPAAPQG
jgi:hypothetical protein